MVVGPNSTPKDEDSVDPTIYRSLVGFLQYLTLTRHGIAHAANKTCQYMQQLQPKHLREVKPILIYHKKALNHDITF